MNRTTPIPLYYQVKSDLIKKIEENVYPVDESLPSELKLMEIYGVSRSTVRQAIECLIHEGYLVRKRGIGTFVKKQNIHFWELGELRNFDDAFKMNNQTTVTKVIQIEQVSPSQKIKDVFSNQYETFFRIERLRSVDGEPAVYVQTYVPCEIAPTLNQEDLENQSLFHILQTKYGIVIDCARKRFRAVNANKEEARWLNIEDNTAIQKVETLVLDKAGQPIEFSISKDRSDISAFHALLKYTQTKTETID